MAYARTLAAWLLTLAAVLTASLAQAQPGADRLADLKRQLTARYPLSPENHVGTDVLATGALLLLLKGDLLMGRGGVDTSRNVYTQSKGIIEPEDMAARMQRRNLVPGAPQPPARLASPGEKLWVANIFLPTPDAVWFLLVSNAFTGTARYRAFLKVPVPRTAGAEQVFALIDEVLKIDSLPSPAALEAAAARMAGQDCGAGSTSIWPWVTPGISCRARSSLSPG